jgi:transcriptional regulator with XRE-family HTH domain
MAIGKRISERLNVLGWRNSQLIKRVPGLSAQALSSIIQRDSKRSQFAPQIAKALGMSLESLLGIEPVVAPEETPEWKDITDARSAAKSDRGAILSLGEKIKQKRIELALTQAELALQVRRFLPPEDKDKMTQGAISDIEANAREKTKWLTYIALALGVSLEYLLSAEPDVAPEEPPEHKDLTAARRARLKAWFKDKPYPSDERSLISQLVNGQSPFGEKVAMRLEGKLFMPNGYLVRPLSDYDRVDRVHDEIKDIMFSLLTIHSKTANLARHVAMPIAEGYLTAEEAAMLADYRKCPQHLRESFVSVLSHAALGIK